MGKIKSLVDVEPEEGVDEEDTRVAYFLETIGFNNSFGFHYFICKTFAALTPIMEWHYLCGFIGKFWHAFAISFCYRFRPICHYS